jgi:CRISPR-associated protein Cas1
MWRVIDLGGSGYFLHMKHNSLLVEKDDCVSTIPFQDIHSIICHGMGFRYSDDFFKQCLANKIPVTFCDEKHVPMGMLLPMLQHTESAIRLDTQLKASVPRKKQAWQQIISQKLLNQSKFLEITNHKKESLGLEVLANNVKSGDTTNAEAQGARIYFAVLYGQDFLRSDDNNAINSRLDYGYTIIRSAVARAVIDCGLLPSCGVFHSMKNNPFCLIDDLMEPLRPMVDSLVYRITSRIGIQDELTPKIKKDLIALTTTEVCFEGQKVEFSYGLRLYVLSYIAFISRESEKIQFPQYCYARSL